MYPIARLLITYFKATRAFKKSRPEDRPGFAEVGETTFTCRPWDLDMFMEMNNGRVLTLFDIGRFDVSFRNGLWKTLLDNKWGLAVAGSTVRYRKRIKLFDKVTIRTQMVGMDERWFYIAQSMWVKGEPCNSVLLRTCVTAKGRSIPTSEVITAVGAEDLELPMTDWVSHWEQADKERPWPPKP